MSMGFRPDLTVIGLDAATLDVVEPLVAEGHLPSLGRLLEEGSGGVLRSTTHPLTPHAWATLVTGVALSGGHSLAEENPGATLKELQAFLV